MSGKFKKYVARSQTLSYISNFSGQAGGIKKENDLEGSLRFFQNSKQNLDIFHSKNGKGLEFSQHFPKTKRVESMRCSPLQADSLCSDLMNKLDININASSEYDLVKKDYLIESNDEIDATEQSFVTKLFGQQNKVKESIFKQSYTKMLKKKLKSSLFSASQLENSTNIQVSSNNDITGLANLTTSQDQGIENRFNQMMDLLKVSENHTIGSHGSEFGSNYSSKIFKQKDCSIVYNSCQIEISCSISAKINNESKRNQLRLQKITQKNYLFEVEEGSPTLLSNHLFANNNDESTQLRIQEIMKEYTQSTISRLNSLNEKMTELKQNQLKGRIHYKLTKYIKEKLRIMKRVPFASISILNCLKNSSSLNCFDPFNFQTNQNKILCTKNDYQTFCSNQPSIVKRSPHFISKFTLDIDSLNLKEICLTTDEFFTFVLPLDPHFPNVILLGTLTGKIFLYQLSKEKPRKQYIMKYSYQLFPLSDDEDFQIYPTCAVQYKSNFYIGGNDGSIHLYDFKKKQVINSFQNIQNKTLTRVNLEKSCFGINIFECKSTQNNENEKNNFGVMNIKATQKKVLFSRQDGTVLLVDNNDLNQILFQKQVEGLLKCDFSCDNDNNIIVLTDEKLEIIHTPRKKIVFKLKPSIQENLVFSDFQVNKLTKEIILLSNSQLLQSSKIQILSNKNTRLKVIDTLFTQYIINNILFDKQMQNMFCIGPNDIKIWQYYNLNEFQNIKQSLLNNLPATSDTPTTNN